MNNNIIFNEDYMLYPYNDHYSSQPLLPFSPSSSSSINNILNHSTPNIHLNHHHQFLQAPSPFYPFEFSPEFAFLFPQSNGHDDNQTITTNNQHHNHHLLSNPIEESQQVMPLETNIEDSQRISTFQEPIMKKIKKPIRTDRHSKIKTAKGTRDRRMRLSVDVAKELFGLQDMLGFDKASKTVEWLLTQAKPEIIKIAEKITNRLHHGGFSSEDESQTRSMETSSHLCELASMWTVDERGKNANMTETRENKVDGRTIRGKRKMSQRRTPVLKKLSKEERAKARERAKDRTKEKMILRRSSQVVNVVEEEVTCNNHDDEIVNNNNNNNKSGDNVNWSCFEVVSTPCEEVVVEELCKNNCFADYFVVVDNKKNHIEQQHQFTDIHQILGKQRDLVYNYHI